MFYFLLVLLLDLVYFLGDEFSISFIIIFWKDIDVECWLLIIYFDKKILLIYVLFN